MEPAPGPESAFNNESDNHADTDSDHETDSETDHETDIESDHGTEIDSENESGNESDNEEINIIGTYMSELMTKHKISQVHITYFEDSN